MGSMLETSGRLLKLLSLLQARRHWPGTELSRRLEVTPRTIRRDVDRLRQLGYPVEAFPGRDGGYRLGAGGELPPLLLDDDEALAVVLGLRTAAGAAITGIAEHSVRALAKFEQILPPRVRHRVSALEAAVVPVTRGGGPTVDPVVLIAVATACRDCEQLRFDCADSAGAATVRKVEPHNLVAWGRRWYLVAWDLEREDWRIFRVDRMTCRHPMPQPSSRNGWPESGRSSTRSSGSAATPRR